MEAGEEAVVPSGALLCRCEVLWLKLGTREQLGLFLVLSSLVPSTLLVKAVGFHCLTGYRISEVAGTWIFQFARSDRAGILQVLPLNVAI